MKLLDDALKFLEANPELYNPGFPLKCRHRVICASEKNARGVCDLKKGRDNSRHEITVDSMTNEIVDSFGKKERGTQTDFLGAVILLCYINDYKRYARQFYSRNTRVAYVRVVEGILDTKANLTGVFISAEPLFPVTHVENEVKFQDLSPKAMYQAILNEMESKKLWD